MEIMKDNEQESFTLELLDEKGNDTTSGLDAAPAWSMDDESVASVVASADGLSAVVSGQKPGVTKLNISASLDGVVAAKSLDIQITAGDAVSFNVKGSAPVPQAPVAPAP